MDKLSIINGYLRELGVDENIISYMTENQIYVLRYFEDRLGKDFYIWSDKYHREEFLQKLKSDSPDFKIFDNGSIWFSFTSDPKIDAESSFARNSGLMFDNDKLKYDKIKTSFYISFENGYIRKKSVTLKEQSEDNQTYYDGRMAEEIKEANSKTKRRTDASFFHSATPVPAKTLKTHIEDINEFGLLSNLEFVECDYNNDLWYLVATGEIKSQNVLANLNPERISAKDKFRLIKQNIFAKVVSPSRLYEQMRKKCMELLTNESLDEIIHSEFSMKGKEGEICTWTLEKVTEASRDIIFQMDFQNTEQFRQQILLPFLTDYAQTNCTLQGRVNPANTGLFQYRAFSTTNNVVTVNNISQETANYISATIQSIEPVIYNRQMEQNEQTLQQENGLGYQKVNKKNSGFLNIFLLSFLVGYASGFILHIIGIILKNNI